MEIKTSHVLHALAYLTLFTALVIAIGDVRVSRDNNKFYLEIITRQNKIIGNESFNIIDVCTNERFENGVQVCDRREVFSTQAKYLRNGMIKDKEMREMCLRLYP